MASIGIHTNGSQFYIALAPMPQLNGRCVTFARIVKGMDSVAAIEKVSTVHAKNNYTAKTLTRNQRRSAHSFKFRCGHLLGNSIFRLSYCNVLSRRY